MLYSDLAGTKIQRAAPLAQWTATVRTIDSIAAACPNVTSGVMGADALSGTDNPGRERVLAARFARNPWLVTLAVAVALSLLSVMQQYLLAALNGRPPRWQDVVFYGADWLALGLLTPLPFYLGQHWPLRELQWRSIAVHVTGFFMFALVWAGLGVLFGWMLSRYPYSANTPHLHLFMSWLSLTAPLSLIIYVGVLGCVYAYSYAREARERAADAARLAAQLSESRLGALRMQLNPHFLFNSLNTLAVLVREQNSSAASRMLDLLAGVLRQVLRTDRPQVIPLEEELRFLSQYLEIEQVRFSDRLDVHWDIQHEARSALLPDFLMQPLVENAIKHGVTKRADGGTISIAARIVGTSLELSVHNDGGVISPSAQRIEGVGLTNTKERLRTLYGGAASVTIESSNTYGTTVLLKIPFQQR